MTKPTSKSLVRAPTTSGALGPAAPEVQRAREFADASTGKNTKRAYKADWEAFCAWCSDRGVQPERAKPAGVAVYLAWMVDNEYAVPSVERAYAGIASRLREADPEAWPLRRRPPAIAKVIQGIRKEIDHEPDAKKPITDKEMDAILTACGEGLIGKRNRALILVGFFGGFRRSELVSLDVEDVAFLDEGLRVRLRRSKTDQKGKGEIKGIMFSSSPKRCPIRALRAWLTDSGITSGALFRPLSRVGHVLDRRLGDRMVAHTVKRAVKTIGLDADDFAGHSLRAGFVTTAARKGKSLDAIMRQTGHKSVATVRRYIRHATVFDDNATEGLL